MRTLPEPEAFVKSSEWNDAKAKRMSFNGWRHDYGDCDMRLYTQQQLIDFSWDVAGQFNAMFSKDAPRFINPEASTKLEEQLEESYWRFDAKRKGYATWHDPMSERDAYKSELRKLLKELK